MKRMAIAYLLGTVLMYHVEASGIDERRGLDTLFFGSIVCLCCAILYVFKHNSTIKRLRAEAGEKDQKTYALQARIRQQTDIIQNKTADYFRIHQQLLDKENKEKTFALLLKKEQRRCAQLRRRCTRKNITMNYMRHLYRIDRQKDADKIKKLCLSLRTATNEIAHLQHQLESVERYYSQSSSSSSSSEDDTCIVGNRPSQKVGGSKAPFWRGLPISIMR